MVKSERGRDRIIKHKAGNVEIVEVTSFKGCVCIRLEAICVEQLDDGACVFPPRKIYFISRYLIKEYY